MSGFMDAEPPEPIPPGHNEGEPPDMNVARYVIRFDYPERTLYAGQLADGALGWAWTTDKAMRFDSRQAAERTLANGYGDNGYGHIEEL